MTVADGGAWRTVELGRLERANRSRNQRLSTDLPCPDGCRLVSIGLRAAANQPYEASFTITAIGTDRQPAAQSHAWLRDPSRWREQSVNQTVPDQTANLIPSGGASGLAVRGFDDRGSGSTSISPTDTADPLPALLAPGTSVPPVPGEEGVGAGTGLDGQQQKLAVVGQAAILPRALGFGVLVDLTNAQGLVDPASAQAIDQVWLAADAPAGTEKALADQGLAVETRESLSTHRSALENQATTRGAAVAMVIAAVALLLSLIALLAARWSDAAHRGSDWRALREGGVSPRRLRGLVAVEIAVPAALAVGVGLLSGAAATMIAAPRLPLVDRSAAGPPLDLRLDWGLVGAIGAGTVLLIMLIAALGAVAEIRPRRWR
jgi:hypothetical protein